MANLNKVFLMGNLTRDPELRYVPSGKAVTTFTIAVNRVYTTQAGEKKEIVSFIRIVVWGRRAEVCGEYLSKGSPVFVEGRLQSRSWETQDGQKRSTLEVIADNIQFLRLPSRQQGAAQGTSDPSSEEIASIDLEAASQPAQKRDNVKTEAAGNAGSVADDVPF